MKKSKVVFLGDTLLNNEPLGIQRYAYEILKQLDEIAQDINIEMIVPESSVCKIHFNNIKIVQYGTGNGFFWRQFKFPHYLKMSNAIGVDLTLGLPLVGCDIVCLHDCIYENYTQDFPGIKNKLKRLSYLIRAKCNVKNSKLILTVSEYSKKELVDYYNISPQKIQVIYNAWQHFQRIVPDEAILERLNLSTHNYYFALGSYLPHKNFQWIINEAIANPEKKFIVTGTNKLDNFLDVTKGNKPNNIIFTGFLKDEEIKALMENCKLFLHPSYYEGFGIPPLEAISSGAKIAISSASCLPEIYGDVAAYFDPDSIADLDDLESQKRKDASYVLDKYSWRDSAEKMKICLQRCLDK